MTRPHSSTAGVPSDSDRPLHELHGVIGLVTHQDPEHGYTIDRARGTPRALSEATIAGSQPPSGIGLEEERVRRAEHV